MILDQPAIDIESGSVKIDISEVAYWIESKADWKTFLTLTFRDIDKTPDQADKNFRWLIRVLNKEVFGKRYTRIVGHSYFSYMVATEYQKRGAIHLHVLIDRPVNYKLIHEFWNRYFGFAQTTIIRNKYSTCIYAIKYCVKDGDWRLYEASKLYKPTFHFEWWK